MNREPEVDWKVFKLIVLFCPALFLVVALATGSWSTVVPLAIFATVVAALVVFRRGRSHAVTLHVAIGLLVLHQTLLLSRTVDEPNIGLVWFLAVPAMVALLGSRIHILVWTPITIGAVAYCWSIYSGNPSLAHPMSLPNLIGVALVISVAAFGVITQRDKREQALTEALAEARTESAERRVAQREASEARDAITTFLGSMSHELRTPLTSIVLSTDLLEKALDDPQHREWVDNINGSAQSLVLLLNDVLDLARSDAGRSALNEQAFDVQTLLKSVSAIVQPLALARGVSLFVGAMPDVPRSWHGDPARIRQVLVNLVNNALQHAGGTHVWLSATREGSQLRLTVGDNGRGIAPDVQRKIFQPFHQITTANTSGSKSGTGLGLTISNGYVAAMGGTLEVASQPDQGAQFSFSLLATAVSDDTLLTDHPRSDLWRLGVSLRAASPHVMDWAQRWLEAWEVSVIDGGQELVLDDNPTKPGGAIDVLHQRLNVLNRVTTKSPESDWQGASGGGVGRCLVCDDDAQILNILGQILRSAGHSTVCFDTSAAMFDYLAEHEVDLVILDVNLNAESGIDALIRLRGSIDALSQIPVCMLSGDMNLREPCLEAGANEYLLKPSSVPELLATVARLIGATTAADEQSAG